MLFILQKWKKWRWSNTVNILYKTLRKINLTWTKLLGVEEGWPYPRFTYLTYKVKSIHLLSNPAPLKPPCVCLLLIYNYPTHPTVHTLSLEQSIFQRSAGQSNCLFLLNKHKKTAIKYINWSSLMSHSWLIFNIKKTKNK